MYISEIDDILDQTLDKLLYAWILEKQIKELDFEKLTSEINFIKFQKEINKILEYAQELISTKDISKIVSNNKNITLITNTITRYIGYYFFLLLGVNYSGKLESFNNNLIEFSRIQGNYKLKIDNFFNTESNSNIIKNTNLIKELTTYILDIINGKNKENNISQDLKGFIETYGKDNVAKLVDLYKAEYDKNKLVLDHNIIKMIIFINLYKNDEKKELFNIIESQEISNGEFIFIDVIIPKSDFFDYSAIETILEPHEIKTSLPDTIFELINEDYSENINEISKSYTDFDLKIQKLLDTHIIIPIVDDFILYHKDNEKYEKQQEVKTETYRKKEDTKIKYIINKINNASDYYKNPSELKKLFYVPLQNRNAVLTNTYEDIKIITKMKNIAKIDNENIDLLNDLITYKLYPYVSFKDFKKNGFVFGADKTSPAFRNVSFDENNKNNFNILQNRIISENMIVNIVGFAIINNDEEIECMDSSTFVDICKNDNNPIQTMKVLLENKIKQKFFPHNTNNQVGAVDLKKNYYWLFDLERQKYSIPYYDISSTMNKNDIVKILSAYLYDWVIESTINIIKENINISESNTITKYIDIFSKTKQKLLDIENPQYTTNVNELEYLMYYLKSIKVKDTYDYNEDNFPGLYGKIHKLPIVNKKKPKTFSDIKMIPDFKYLSEETSFNLKTKSSKNQSEELKDVEEDENIETNEYINSVCQHIITWDKIAELQKNKNSKYMDLVYEFMQQYIVVNPNQDYICKSCKSAISIKKYISDGTYDNATQQFVTFAVNLDVNLEELPEYEKFKVSIKTLDKIIDRICSIINFQGLTGFNSSVRSKRKNIVKNTLDIVINHNNYLTKSSYLSNRNKITQSFGINSVISIFYVFELDNSVFVYSSKDKDFYKLRKYDNVIAYIIILLFLEISDTQILSLNNDKLCGYFTFKKIGYSLFNNFKIITNKSQDAKPIQDYPILCYLIFLFSCYVTKYKIWADLLEGTEVIDTKKNFPVIQKTIIHTVIELFNSILQVDTNNLKSHKAYIFEQFQSKYYYKIDLFKDTNLIKKLDKMYLSDGQAKIQKKIQIENNKFDISADITNYKNDYMNDDLYQKYMKVRTLRKLTFSYDNKKIPKINTISNLSNCVSGEFHDFKIKNKDLVCSKCGEMSNPNKLIKDSELIIGDKYIIHYLRKLAMKYCKDGSLHQFIYEPVSDTNYCSKCKYIKGEMVTYSDKELFKLYDTIENSIKTRNLYIHNIIKKKNVISDNEISTVSNLFTKILYKFEKYDNNLTKTINTLLDNIQKLLGTDIIIDNNTHHLFWNIYIIDHDYLGNKLETPISIYEKENKFRIIENHPHFKKTVIVFSTQSGSKYDLFYDFQTKNLLGYRESSKDYISNKNIRAKLKINYSFKNIFSLFGFTREQINIQDFYPDIFGMTSEHYNKYFSNFNMMNFINKIACRRFSVIKKLGIELKKYINRFRYNYKINIITIEATFTTGKNETVTNTYVSETANNPLDLIYDKFSKKISSNIVTEFGEKSKNKDFDLEKFLKYTNVINLYLPFEKIKMNSDNDDNNDNNNIKFSETINYISVLKHDYTSNVTINYIYDEIIKLLTFNTNKNIKTNIIQFILEIICNLFNQTFYDVSKFNNELNNFYQILYTSEFYLETQTNEFMVDAFEHYTEKSDNPTEEEQEKIDDDEYDAKEQIESLDMGDDEIDAEGLFELYLDYGVKSDI